MAVPSKAGTAPPEREFLPPKRRFLPDLGRLPNPVFAWLVLLPAILGLAAFSIIPMASGLWRSLQDPGVGGGMGLIYYEQMINDPVFRIALKNNLIFAGITVPVSLALAMLMAVLVNRHFRGRSLVRLARVQIFQSVNPANLPFSRCCVVSGFGIRTPAAPVRGRFAATLPRSGLTSTRHGM